jgi:hypothetical protein
MAQYIPHDKEHPQAGMWGRSIWVWHVVAWSLDHLAPYEPEEVDNDGLAGSLCDRYVSPPFVPRTLLDERNMCKKCEAVEQRFRKPLHGAATGR